MPHEAILDIYYDVDAPPSDIPPVTSGKITKIYFSGKETEKLVGPLMLIVVVAFRFARDNNDFNPLFLGGTVLIAALIGWALYRINRLEITDIAIRRVSLFPDRRFNLPWFEATDYRSGPAGHWVFLEDGVSLLVHRFQIGKLHRQVLDHAPWALNAIKATEYHVPPARNFIGLWTFDATDFIKGRERFFLWIGLNFVLNGYEVALPLLLIAVFIFILRDFGNRISIDDRGVTLTTLTSTVMIEWDEVEAVFKERRRTVSGYTLIAGSKAIFVPHKVCKEKILVRKLLFSLPSETLLVNFRVPIPKRPPRIPKPFPYRIPRGEVLEPTF